MSNSQIKHLAEELTIGSGLEYQSKAYRSTLKYWLVRIRREVKLNQKAGVL